MITKLATEDLLDLHDVFEENDILFWPDFGTLLGIVRDKSLLEWDSDIDLAGWQDDRSKIVSIIPKLKNLGFSVKVSCNEISFNRKSVGINIQLYNKNREYAWRLWEIYSPYKFGTIFALLAQMIENDDVHRSFISVEYQWLSNRKHFLFFKIVDFFSLFFGSFPKKIKRKFIDGSWNIWQRCKGEFVIEMIPIKFFSKFDSIKFNDRIFFIPFHVEDYLQLHYGNWQIPVKKWDYNSMDKTFVRKHDEQLIVKLAENKNINPSDLK